MLAQHIVIARIFKKMFAKTGFDDNPLTKAIEGVTNALPQSYIALKLKPLERAYQSMEVEVGTDFTPEQRVDLLRKIYEGFLEKAIPGVVKELGIVLYSDTLG